MMNAKVQGQPKAPVQSANQINILEENENIPEEFLIAEETLRLMQKSAVGPGNFASKCTKYLFLELFGASKEKFLYSWCGGGTLKKKALCVVRKEIVKKYVVMFYPKMQEESQFRERIVPKINELLRRREKQSVLNSLPAI